MTRHPARVGVRRLLAVALGCAVLLGAGACTGRADPGPTSTVAGGAAALPGPAPADLRLRPAPAGAPAAPAVTGQLTDGTRLALADLWAQRPVVLVFFSSWCGTCGQRQEALAELARGLRDRVVFVGVTADEEPAELAAYLRTHRVDHPVVVDAEGAIWRAYAMREPPGIAVIAKGGRLLRGWPGGVPASTVESVLRQQVLAP
ncbi:MAG TPA: TlpA disulfide reductase family protein [Pilimelia sp.]|nr:TlpA disulfide reductase family protein [Pilimelia sp.]